MSDSDGQESPRDRFYVVGIGASAGGLEALSAMIGQLPAQLGAAYVVVQHLSPTYRSMLVQLLGRETSITVKEAEQGEVLAPDTIYITPPNRNVLLREGAFLLTEPPPQALPKPSINAFLFSLAEARGEEAIAVILSGTGSDGASGVRAIKAGGGLVFAQDPAAAKYAGMPQAAIDTECVDWVLGAEAIADELATVVRTVGSVVVPERNRDVPVSIGGLLARVFRHTRVDFSGYKENAVWRRILRRIATNRVDSLEQYIELTERNPDELGQLCKEILISVTLFFRDPDTFTALRGVLAERLATKQPGDEFRVWVPGCATGEEAYSLAILLRDLCREQSLMLRLQIFATDIDMTAMSIARRGFYTAAAIAELPADLVQRHFVPVGEGYEVSKSLREVVVFARQDLLQDPPFLRIDLISCRNVLIYFQGPLQEKVLGTFHYSLGPGGTLLLGKSESVQQREELFAAVSPEARIFRRIDVTARPPVGAASAQSQRSFQRQERERSAHELLVEAAALAYVPPSVLIDASGDVLHIHGDTSQFLQIPAGRPDLNVLNLIRKDFRAELQALIHQCRQRRDVVLGRIRPLPGSLGERSLRLVARPVSASGRDMLQLLSFELQLASPAQTAELPDAAQSASRDMEDELIATREHLQTVIEELETSNEETQALNEELQASNEELQAANEELQSANEELQSTNEELTTVNEELQIKTAELTDLNIDLESIQNSFGFALLVVSEQTRLLRYNNVAARLFALSEDSLGDTLSVVLARRGLDTHKSLVEEVIGDGRARDRQVSDDRGHYLMRVFPRPAVHGSSLGAVITLIDETELIEAQRRLRDSQGRLVAIMDNSNALISVKNPLGRYQYVNPRLAALIGIEQDAVGGLGDGDIYGDEAAEAIRRRDLDVLASGRPSELEEEVRIAGNARTLRSLRFVLRAPDGSIDAICIKSNDVTDYVSERRRWRAWMDAWRMVVLSIDGALLLEFDAERMVTGESSGHAPLVSAGDATGVPQTIQQRLSAMDFDVRSFHGAEGGVWEWRSATSHAIAYFSADGGFAVVLPIAG